MTNRGAKNTEEAGSENLLNLLSMCPAPEAHDAELLPCRLMEILSQMMVRRGQRHNRVKLEKFGHINLDRLRRGGY